MTVIMTACCAPRSPGEPAGRLSCVARRRPAAPSPRLPRPGPGKQCSTTGLWFAVPKCGRPADISRWRETAWLVSARVRCCRPPPSLAFFVTMEFGPSADAVVGIVLDRSRNVENLNSERHDRRACAAEAGLVGRRADDDLCAAGLAAQSQPRHNTHDDDCMLIRSWVRR